MASLSNSRWQNCKGSSNRSTNNGDIAEKAKRPLSEYIFDIYLITEILSLLWFKLNTILIFGFFIIDVMILVLALPTLLYYHSRSMMEFKANVRILNKGEACTMNFNKNIC